MKGSRMREGEGGVGGDVKTGVWKTGGYKLVEMDQR